MKQLDYYVLDVFTSQRYEGNQLSVVHTDEELELKQYQNIASEFGYAETSFVHYSEEESIFKVRSFTPAGFEVGGAGHNLLGAVCLALLKKREIFKNQHENLRVKMKDAEIPLKITEQGGLPFVAMKQRPALLKGTVPTEIVAKATGLDPEDLSVNGWGLQIVETEATHLMVPVRDIATLKRAIPDKTLLKQASERFGFEGYYLFSVNEATNPILAESRFFNPGIGIDEDSATGSAAGPLAGYLHSLGYIKKDKDYKLLQGAYVNRPSTIQVNVAEDGIWVSGSSVIVMEGKLFV